MIVTKQLTLGGSLGVADAASKVFRQLVDGVDGQAAVGYVYSSSGKGVCIRKPSGGSWQGEGDLKGVVGSAVVGIMEEGEPSTLLRPVVLQLSGIAVTCPIGYIEQLMTPVGMMPWPEAVAALQRYGISVTSMGDAIKYLFSQTEEGESAYSRILQFLRLAVVQPFFACLCADLRGGNVILARQSYQSSVYVVQEDGHFEFGGESALQGLDTEVVMAVEGGERVHINEDNQRIATVNEHPRRQGVRGVRTYRSVQPGEVLLMGSNGGLHVNSLSLP